MIYYLFEGYFMKTAPREINMPTPFLNVEALKTAEAKKMHRVANKLSKRQRTERRPSKAICYVFETPKPIEEVQYMIYGGSKNA